MSKKTELIFVLVVVFVLGILLFTQWSQLG